MKRSWLAAAAVGLAACSELPAIDRGVCGNRVVEPGEDCDGATATGTCAEGGDNACFFVCEPTAAVRGCPDGFQCGLDQRCRMPAGEFAANLADAPTVRFDVEDFRVGDVDGDGVGDVMGGNTRAIRVRFGGPGGALGTELDVATRLPTGPFDFTRFDDNETMDAVVPVGVGVFSLVADGADLVPVAYSSIQLPMEQELRIAAVEVVADIDSELLVIDDRSMGFLHAVGARVPLPGAFTSADLAGQLAVGDLHALRSGAAPGSPDACPGTPVVDPASEVALAFLGDDRVYVASTGGCDQVLVQANSLAITSVREVLLPGGSRVSPGGAYFGRFDSDQCLDMLVATVGPCIAGTCDQLALASGVPSGPGQCTGGLGAARTIFVAAGGRTFQPFQPIAVGDFDVQGDSNGIDDLVLADRVVQTQCGSCLPQVGVYGFGFLALAAAPWASAVITDINRDGNPDVAARVEGADDLDLLLGTGIGPFNRYQIDTSAPVIAIATGDFDGDLFLDIAIAERGAADAGDVVSVAFGSPAGGPSAPVAMGTFGTIGLIAPVSSVGDVESIDVATDLVVVADRTSELGDRRAAAVLLGDTSRRMVAPFLLRVAADRVPDVPRAAVAGSLDAETGVDLAVIAEPGAVLDSDTEVRPPRLWLLRGDASGEIVEATPRELGAGGLAIGAFEPLDALYAVGELDGELPNEIVGIDHTAAELPLPDQISRLLIVRATATVTTEVLELPALGGVRSVRLADLDADGDVDLYAAFGAAGGVRGGAGPSPPHLLVVWNQGGALDVAGAVEITVADVACRDLAPIQADADPALELALLCSASRRSSLVVADLDAAGVYVPAAGRLELGVTADNIEVGDVDGDTIDDVLVHTDDGTLRVVRQCSVGELGCTAEGGIE